MLVIFTEIVKPYFCIKRVFIVFLVVAGGFTANEVGVQDVCDEHFL